MARSQADIANTAVRIFLQDMGVAYDEMRGYLPYQKRNFPEICSYFSNRCCYCAEDLSPKTTAQDHLIPLNKSELGLHAWGNIVPACQDCNSVKQGKPWQDFLVKTAGPHTQERYQRIQDFVTKYRYAPELRSLRDTADELYAEVGAIAMTLIAAKIVRGRKTIAQ